jgi:hypothetical protein
LVCPSRSASIGSRPSSIGALERRPLLNPILLTIAAACAMLVLLGVPYAADFESVGFLHYLLGTAVVALCGSSASQSSKAHGTAAADGNCVSRRIAHEYYLRFAIREGAWGLRHRRAFDCTEICNRSSLDGNCSRYRWIPSHHRLPHDRDWHNRSGLWTPYFDLGGNQFGLRSRRSPWDDQSWHRYSPRL